jgi:hypothetical protein
MPDREEEARPEGERLFVASCCPGYCKTVRSRHVQESLMTGVCLDIKPILSATQLPFAVAEPE